MKKTLRHHRNHFNINQCHLQILHVKYRNKTFQSKFQIITTLAMNITLQCTMSRLLSKSNTIIHVHACAHTHTHNYNILFNILLYRTFHYFSDTTQCPCFKNYILNLLYHGTDLVLNLLFLECTNTPRAKLFGSTLKNNDK